ncbi:sigma factor-like helix-turn-helix DNA-binding protein [uncultured Clostridium sp.]|uniref:RNA polymerase sigma factor n=1 Tax=uncultured Clostridium sp. TaxID=59620 RepID=UPI0028EE9805|nr:sigma factor-like helix-turn-helix DNA-binding protein [uncultured Clostridium sp.]
MEITIKLNGQAVSVEVSIEVYTYLDQATHKDENLAHEQLRHWDMRELDEQIIVNECSRSYILTPEQIACRKETLAEIMAVLNACTDAQRQRFLLYALEGMSYAEIGRHCKCSKYAVRDSITAVRKKYQEFLQSRPHETHFSG